MCRGLDYGDEVVAKRRCIPVELSDGLKWAADFALLHGNGVIAGVSAQLGPAFWPPYTETVAFTYC